MLFKRSKFMKESDHFGTYVRSLSLHFCKGLYPELEPMTSWSQDNSFTTIPGLPFCLVLFNIINKFVYHSSST
jgi:hypothetical protein